MARGKANGAEERRCHPLLAVRTPSAEVEILLFLGPDVSAGLIGKLLDLAEEPVPLYRVLLRLLFCREGQSLFIKARILSYLHGTLGLHNEHVQILVVGIAFFQSCFHLSLICTCPMSM